jgi:hypothetical protein
MAWRQALPHFTDSSLTQFEAHISRALPPSNSEADLPDPENQLILFDL